MGTGFPLVDLHADPFERAEEEAADYFHWRIDRVYLLVPAQAFVGQWLQSFESAAAEAGEFQPGPGHATNLPDRKTVTTESRFLRIRYGEQLDTARHYSILCNGKSALWLSWLMSPTAPCVQAANAGTVQTTEKFGEI